MDQSRTQWRAQAGRQFEAILDGVDAEFETLREAAENAAAESAQSKIAETLNQGLRRLRQTTVVEDAATLAVELSAPFAARCAVFVFQEGRGVAKAARGLGPLPLTFLPDEGAAFRAAVETRDPVIAMGTDAEISLELATRVGRDSTDRVFIFPIAVRKEVIAVVFATGSVAFAPMELIAGLTAIQMEALTPVASPQRADLIAIRGVESSVKASQSWTDLPADLQALHLRAQREARLRVAAIRLEHGDALRGGLERSNVYESVREPIDAARAAFRQGYLTASPTMVDYLYLELVRGLVHDHEELLGPSFPGPLV